MDLLELLTLLKSGEGPHVEFKSDFPKQAQDLAKELAAFANSGGGVLLLGVDDEGTPCGVAESARAVERLAGVARTCSPPLSPEIDRVHISPSAAIVYARVGQSAPTLLHGKIYLRVGSTCVEASGGDEINALLGRSASKESVSTTPVTELFTPPPCSVFVGRAAELDRLATVFASEAVSLVVLQGISGIGKTALCATFASQLASRGYRSFWLDCRIDTSFDSLTSALAVFARMSEHHTVADTIEDVSHSIDTRIGQIAAAISSWKLGIFLNDYHESDDPLLDRCLQRFAERSVHCKMVLTARRRPRLATIVSPVRLVEETIQLGLDTKASGEFLAACGLSLPEEMARQVWRLTGDGHPKAIEIFAARSRRYPVTDLLSSLPRFREDLTKEWLSPLLNELTPAVRGIAIDLSVFDRPLPESALKWLYPTESVAEAIAELVDRFILDRVEPESLRMHPLVREFCYGLMTDRTSRHKWAADYYLELAGAEDDEAATDSHVEARMAGWTHLVRCGEGNRAVEQLEKLRRPLMSRGRYEQLMFLMDQTPLTSQSEQWRAIDRARIASLWGDQKKAEAQLRELLDAPQDEAVAREAVLVLAATYIEHGMAGAAKALLIDERARFGSKLLPIVLRRYLSRLVEACSGVGDLDEALGWASKLVEGSEAVGDEVAGGRALRQMASVLREKRQLDPARSLCELSIELLGKRKRSREVAVSRLLLGRIERDRGETQTAIQLLREALAEFQRMGDRVHATACRAELTQARDCLPKV